MSDLDQEESRAQSRSEAIETRAADWMLARRMAESWSDADQSALDAWLAESPAHLLAYWRLEETWSRAHRLKALQSPTGTPSVPSKRLFKRYVIGFAASGGISIIAIAMALGQYFIPSTKTYVTPVGGHLTLALTDGSKIDLNTDTVLSISEGRDGRVATLSKGEAYFQIKHDAVHPFVLSVSDHRVTDLGTAFLVRDDNAHVRVALMEGRARFESANAAAPIQATDLAPGDVVTATTDSFSVSKTTAEELKSNLGWRRGVLTFFHTPLAEAANEFNRYNRKKLVVADADAARLRVDGTFLANNVELFGGVAHVVFGLHVQNLGNEVIISR